MGLGFRLIRRSTARRADAQIDAQPDPELDRDRGKTASFAVMLLLLAVGPILLLYATGLPGSW